MNPETAFLSGAGRRGKKFLKKKTLREPIISPLGFFMPAVQPPEYAVDRKTDESGRLLIPR